MVRQYAVIRPVSSRVGKPVLSTIDRENSRGGKYFQKLNGICTEAPDAYDKSGRAGMKPIERRLNRAVGSNARVGERGNRDRVDIAQWR